VVGGRFEVVDQVDEDPQGVVWSAKDQQTKRSILVRVIKPEMVPAAAAPEFREACRAAATLTHRNIARVFGVGRTPKGEHFVASEWIDGVPLSEFIQARDRDGDPISLRGVYNVVAHLCSALSYAHEKGPHGTLRPSVISVTRGGRVKIHDFGVGQVLLETAGPSAFRDSDHACLAPEVKRGEPATTRSDVFGIGAILYELLTRRRPGSDFVAPSEVRDDISPDVDRILLDCLAPDPADRFDSPESMRDALLPFLKEANSSPPPEPGVSVDIDIINSVAPPPDVDIPVFSLAPEPSPSPPTPPRRGLMSLINQLSSDSKRSFQRPGAHRAAQRWRLRRRRRHVQRRYGGTQSAPGMAAVSRIHFAAGTPRHRRGGSGGPGARAKIREALLGDEIAHRRVHRWPRGDRRWRFPSIPLERCSRGRIDRARRFVQARQDHDR
jgi:serine/threonine protein kinase